MDSEQQIIETWAAITVKSWQSKIDEMGINRSFALSRSFVYHIISNAGGDVAKIEFAFNYYGRFLDMGVGKGINIGNTGKSSSTGISTGRRSPRKWYTKPFAHEVKRLAEIMAEQLARRGATIIIQEMEAIG